MHESNAKLQSIYNIFQELHGIYLEYAGLEDDKNEKVSDFHWIELDNTQVYSG